MFGKQRVSSQTVGDGQNSLGRFFLKSMRRNLEMQTTLFNTHTRN